MKPLKVLLPQKGIMELISNTYEGKTSLGDGYNALLGTKSNESKFNPTILYLTEFFNNVGIFEAAGLEKPDISILSEEFLAEVRELPQKNLAFEMLKKLLNDQIRIKMKKNIVQARSFREMLEKAVLRYTNRNIEAAQVIEELIQLAKEMKEEDKRGKELNLTEDELAFYDVLGVNDSAVKVLGDKTLRMIAIELTEAIRRNVTIDWTLRENVQARLRVMVKRILKKYGYPPDKQKKATQLVLEPAHVICKDWTKGGYIEVLTVVWEDTKLVYCPFCDDGTVRVIHVPAIKKETVTRGSSINKRSNVYTKENYTVLEDCPCCKATKEKIEKALNSGEDYKKPSRERVLERMKKAGLSTRI